jgi:hypothetical protein
MPDRITSTFIHVEEMKVGAATMVDEHGTTNGLVLAIQGEDNETGEEVMLTLAVPAEIAVAAHVLLTGMVRSKTLLPT